MKTSKLKIGTLTFGLLYAFCLLQCFAPPPVYPPSRGGSGGTGGVLTNNTVAAVIANFYTNDTPHWIDGEARLGTSTAGRIQAAVTNSDNTLFFHYQNEVAVAGATSNTISFKVPPGGWWKFIGLTTTATDGSQQLLYTATNGSVSFATSAGNAATVTDGVYGAGLAAGSYAINGVLTTNLQDQFTRTIPFSGYDNFSDTRLVLGPDKTHNIDPGSWPFGEIRFPSYARIKGKVFLYFSSNDTNDAVRGGVFGFAGNDWGELGFIGQMITNSTSGWDSGHVYGGRVFTYMGTNWMAYMGGTETDQISMADDQVGLAYSTDGTNFTKYSGNPILTKGTYGTDYDGTRIQHPTLFEANGQFYLFYTAWRYANSNAIAFATAGSITGPWTKYSGNPVVQWHESGMIQTHAESPTILADKDGYHMWFDAFSDVAGPRQLMETLATAHSQNLTNWTINTERPDVFGMFGKTNTQNWIFGPHIVNDGGFGLLWEDNSSVYLSKPVTKNETKSANIFLGNGYMISTNALTVIPTAPTVHGQSFMFNSNGYPYILLSTNGGGGGALTWTRTNKLGW